MPIVRPPVPVPFVGADPTTKEILSSSATSIPANKAPVELTLIARQMVSAPSAGAEPTTLGTPSQDVALSLALQVLVERTLTAHHLDRRLFANARQIMSAIRTQTVGSIPARALPVDKGRSVRTMVERQFASALLSTLATHTCLVVSIPASKMLVALTPIAPEVERELCVLVDLATWAPPTAGLAAVPTLASQGFAARAQSAKMLEVVLSVSVFLATREILTLDVYRENVTRTKTVDLRGRVRTTSVSTLVPSLVARVPTALYRTMWPYAGVRGEPPEIHSAIVGDSQERRFVLLAAPTLTVRWDLTTGQSVGARTPTLGTRCRVADTSATRTMSAASPRSATGSATGVRLLAGKECAGKTPTVKRLTTERNVPAHLISWEMLTPDVTPSAPATMTARPTRPASD